MILRRLVEGLRRKDWFMVAMEVGIVVLGVFIGIEVSNWNDDRQNRAAAGAYMERLEVDLEAQRSMWENAQAYFNQTYLHANAALDALVGPVDDLDADFLIDLYQASQSRYFTDRRATYDELVATGRIEYLDNPTLRDALSTNYHISTRWLNVMNVRSDYRAILRQLMDHRVQEAIVASCGDIYIQTRFGIAGMRLPESCSIKVNPNLIREEIIRLHGHEEILRHLRFQAATLRTRLAAIETAIAGTTNSLGVLREARGEIQ